MIKSAILAGATLVFGAFAASAQGVPASPEAAIEQRTDLMSGVGDATRTGVQMVRGQAAFDLDAARDVLRTYAAAAERMPSLFPEGSETGGDTSAAPSIWSDRAGFEQRFADWGAAAAGAVDGVTDLESFGAAFGPLANACSACHQDYRVRRN